MTFRTVLPFSLRYHGPDIQFTVFEPLQRFNPVYLLINSIIVKQLIQIFILELVSKCTEIQIKFVNSDHIPFTIKCAVLPIIVTKFRYLFIILKDCHLFKLLTKVITKQIADHSKHLLVPDTRPLLTNLI